MPKLFKYSKVIYTSWKTKKLIKLFIIIYDHLTHDIIDSNFVVEQILTQKKKKFVNGSLNAWEVTKIFETLDSCVHFTFR
jgi:hypothetical protein